VFYVSYDGMGEPLGRSQVLSYLFRLAETHEITLFSFEKPDADVAALTLELGGRGIEWRPLRYHKRPPVLSTLLDAVAGCRALSAAARHQRPDIVHVRSYVPALIALWAKRWTGARLVFDIRGFWVDERVEGGIWPADRRLYRALYGVGKWCERRFFATADAVVTLTHASLPQIRAWAGREDIDVTVIPTCVDLDRFRTTERRQEGPVLTWCGSIGTWYRFDLVPALAMQLGFPLQVVTRQPELAAEILDGTAATVMSLAPDEVPGALRAGDVGLSLCVGSFSKIASAPTRFAEYLAAGMPVIVTPGIGDLVTIVEQKRVGVVLRGEDAAALRDAARNVMDLISDPDLTDRCRSVARELFDVEAGSRRYSEVYDRLLTT
jgi:glycosyltransferase involved in cell wall biosynthesis